MERLFRTGGINEGRARGLFRRGARWWLRVRSPFTGRCSQRSTGTADVALATRIAGLLAEMGERRALWEWLDAAERGDVALDLLYEHHAAGTLADLRAARDARAAARENVDLEPWVERWQTEHLSAIEGITEGHREHYTRHVRAFIPAGQAFPRASFTEDYVKVTLAALRHPLTGAPLAPRTKLFYLQSLKRFIKYARKRVPLLLDPLAEAEDWAPRPRGGRTKSWDYETVRRVLDAMKGEPRALMALVFGSGIELGAALAMQGQHVTRTGERTITAPGTKNEHREDRRIFVDAWAWAIFEPHTRGKSGAEPLWPGMTKRPDGRIVRRAFYAAQVACGLVAAPPVAASGVRLWGSVDVHKIHDARHTYCEVRMLGLDGEPRQDIRYCAAQLGHADEQMVMKIYAKKRLSDRLRTLALREARQAGQRSAEEKD